MRKLKKVDDSLEVNAASIPITLESFKNFTLLASQILLSEGIGEEGSEGLIKVDPNKWVKLQSYLNALFRIGEQVGDQVIFDGGMAVPKYATFPPNIKSIEDALQTVDVAYHMNHKKDGVVMFDPQTGTMTEGIGHYKYVKDPGNQISMICDTLYPEDYDRGVLLAMARRFQPNATLVHDDTQPCRRKRGQSCTFRITWK